jgi:hypothetical protein
MRETARSGYSRLLKEKPTAAATHSALSLPWLTMPSDAATCERIADRCADLLDDPTVTTEEKRFLSSLRAHIGALGQHFATRDANAAPAGPITTHPTTRGPKPCSPSSKPPHAASPKSSGSSQKPSSQTTRERAAP